MSTTDPENIKTEAVASNSDAFSIHAMLRMAWSKKYWILLSIAICMSVAYLWYKRQTPLYGSSAEVMLLFGNDESSASSGALRALADINGSSYGNVNFFNEMEVMRSPALLKTVVERLNLTTSYKTEGFGHDIDLYGKNPINVNFLEVAADSTASLRLQKTGSGKLIATDFTSNGKHLESKPLRITPGTVVETPIGMLAISSTTEFDKFPEYVDVIKSSEDAVAKRISSQITTTKKSEDNSVVVLHYNDVSQERAIDVINGVIDAYHSLWVAEQSRSAINTSNFINERLAVLEQELSGIDSDISEVKSSSQVSDFNTAATMYYSQSMNYDTRAFEASTQLSIAEFLRDYLNDSSNASALIPANTGTSGTVESQIQEYNKMVVKRDQLLQNGTEANPVIAQMNSDLANSRALILASLNNLISQYSIEVSRAQGRGRDFSGKVSSVPEQEKRILSVERQQKVKENLYLYLLQKREENELARMVQVDNTRIIRSAYATGVVAGTLSKALAVGFLIGLAIPMLIIFLVLKLNTKVTRKSDLASLPIPFISEIPLNPSRKSLKKKIRRLLHPNSRQLTDKELKLVVREHSRTYINEAFRMLRTNLDFMSNSETGCEVIMITSFNPGSGKTFIALNLAKSLSLKSKKVLLIDLDLRRASLSIFSCNATQGISTFLTGKSGDILSLIKHNNRNTGIDTIPVGAIPPNPAELILSSRFEDMIATLRQNYDYIVMDCPPYDIVADTALISRVADISLFIVRAKLFNKAALPELEELYRSNKLNHMAIILNGIDAKDSYYYYRYGYSSKDSKGYYISEVEAEKMINDVENLDDLDENDDNL